ncbi:MAG: hypothetical protein RML15_03400 [Bacteroidota bacterium]|nr:hypothetical protein [Candidatus Kapabacteria bacterium]MCS7301934.1 hypothetical protein [Candidatus Kapabacteria bacterium]MCX7936610.1 hypothetical protein [Chlorobiota bacterium]MDW8074803.1 hypothetical protein [Bacteroidota bacterium]MDW8271442.1 hypothetical protein [Bacteroidota bacterium]
MGVITHPAVSRVLTSVRSLDTSTAALLIAVAAETAGDRDLLQAAVETYLTFDNRYDRLYELLIQTYLFAGFPAVIEGLKVAHRVAHAREIHVSSNIRESYNPDLFIYRGTRHFHLVYGAQADQVQRLLHELSPELEQWILLEGYGKILARPFAVSPLEREFGAIVALAVGTWHVQLRSHLHAAAALGASSATLSEVLLCAETVVPKEHMQPAYEYIARL